MEKQKLLDRIQKLFALSSSPEPAEAAAALAKAQTLMSEHGLTRETFDAVGIRNEYAEIGTRRVWPFYAHMLVTRIGRLTSTRAFVAHRKFEFIGRVERVDVAVYLTVVLWRKLQRARATYVSQKLWRVTKRKIKIDRGDAYCEGWVKSALQNIGGRGVSPQDELAINAFINVRDIAINKNEAPARKIARKNAEDVVNGYTDGEGVVVNESITGDDSSSQLRLFGSGTVV